jgi:U5 small nuclear ribonucleoprotein component
MFKRFLDNTLIERHRKCTMFSKPISLILGDKTGKDHLFNTIDTPGHPDFISETKAAMEISDGVLFVLDVVEGLTIDGKRILKEIIKKQLDVIYVINKIDRLVLDLRIPPDDAYLKIHTLIEEVNAFLREENQDCFVAKELNPGNYFKQDDECDFSRKSYRMRMTKPNVLIASGKYNILFSLRCFSEIYFHDMQKQISLELGTKLLWGDVYYNTLTGEYLDKQKAKNLNLKRTFVEFVMEPLYKIFAHCVAKEDVQLREFCLKIGLILPKKNLYDLTLKKLLQTIFGSSLYKIDNFVKLVLNEVQNPLEGNKRIINNILVKGNVTPSRAFVYIVKLYPDIPDDGDTPENFYGFGRVLNGELQAQSASNYVLVNSGFKIEQMVIRNEQFLEDILTDSSQEDKFQIKLKDFFVYNSNFKIKLKNAFPGNFVLFPLIGNVINKSGFFYEVSNQSDLTQESIQQDSLLVKLPDFSNESFVKIGLEPLKPSQLPQMLQGLRSINKTITGLKTKVEESGEHLILGTGELMTDTALNLLREVFTSIEVKITEPTATFSETVIQKSKTLSPSYSADRELSLALLSSPLERSIFDNINYLTNTRPDLRTQFISETCETWDSLSVKGLWTFGPHTDYPNALVEDLLMTEDSKNEAFGYEQQQVKPLLSCMVNGFNWAMREGPLCEEPIQHCKVNLVDMKCSGEFDDIPPSKVIPLIRKGTHASFLLASPRLLEPVYDIEILCSQDSLPSVYEVLSRRRGQILSENKKPGTPLFVIIARLPTLDSFGFEVDLKCHTLGQASVRCIFGGWEIIPGDPLDSDIKVNTLEPAGPLGLAKDVLVKTRRRKGLSQAISLMKYFDDEIVLEGIKERDIFKGIL